MELKPIKTIGAAAFVAVLTAALGVWLWSSEAEVLFRAQELSLFLPTEMFYRTSTIYPGGTLTWAAAYMTQFFYHPALGVALLVAAWWLIVGQLCHVFRLRGERVLLAALVPLALMGCMVQTGYWLYYQKLQGHLWVPTLGVLFSLLVAQVCRLLPGWWRAVWVLAVGLAGYPLMGAWSFLALGLAVLVQCSGLVACLLGEGGEQQKRNAMSLTSAIVGTAAFSCLLVPIVACNFWYHQTCPSAVRLAAMPCFQFGKQDMPEYRTAYWLLLASFLPAIAASVLAEVRSMKYEGKTKIASPRLLLLASYFLLIFFGLWQVQKRWYRDTNFYKEVAMTNCIERLDWEGVLRAMLSKDYGEQKPPTRVMVMEKNLALFRLGRIGDEMFRYPEGAEQQNAPWQVRMTQVGGKMLYYYHGKAQFCYRWCMEDGVEYGWSASLFKYMTKTSLLNHDWQVARKYIDLLKKTRYHREWAERYEKLVGRPDLMAEDEEMKPIVPMSQFPDRLDGDMTLVEMYLLKTFANGRGADIYYQEMTLVCSMIMKDIDLFWPRFQQYIHMHKDDPGFRVPVHYQEAAYLYSMLEPQRPSQMWPGMTNAEALQRIPFDESVKKSYADFMQFNQQCGAMTEEQKARAFLPLYGHTFYYFYFLVRNQKTN